MGITDIIFIGGLLSFIALPWKYHYSRNKRYAELEAEAKRQRLNIFSETNPVNPYNYRQRNRR